MGDPSPFHFWMDWGVQAVVGAGTLLVAGAAVFADSIKAKFVRLSIDVDSIHGTYQPFVKVVKQGDQIIGKSDSIPARFYRLRVTNGSRRFPAHRTTVWLLKIDHHETDGTWRGEIPLTWQHEDFLPGPRVIGEHPAFADLFSISSEGALTIQVRNPPVGLKHIFRGPCELWLTVQARSDESSSEEYRFHIRWDGNWDPIVERMKVDFEGRKMRHRRSFRSWLNAIGLSLGILGVIFIFVWGPPQPSFERGDAITASDNTRLSDGRTVAQRDRDIAAEEQYYKLMSRIGLGLILVGFVVQLANEVLPQDRPPSR